jgi:tetratricopeptide (TPR) repeat protein
MIEEQTYTDAEAHRFFAIHFNGQSWDLLNRAERTKEEDELMLYSAQASCRHWLEAGTGVNHQRGEWLIARVYSVLGLGEAALRHAERCLQLSKQHTDLMKDFDWAFAYESVARANAVAGNRDEALQYVELAQKAGDAIEADQDKEILFGDFDRGEWHGLR